MNKLGLEALKNRLGVYIENMREHDVIEIKQKGFIPGEISIVMKSTKKEDYVLNEKNDEH